MTSVTLYHMAPSRSSTVLWALEEIGAPYDVKVLDVKGGENRRAPYLAINPLGKVPAIEHKGVVVTETTAILTYLADEFPKAGLAPPIGDPLRGPYLRWLAIYAACLEPAVVDRAMKRDPGAIAMSPYGSYDTLIDMVDVQLAKGPWLLGERFTSADVMWGSSIAWMTGWDLLPKRAAFLSYLDRINARPARQRAQEKDKALQGQAMR